MPSLYEALSSTFSSGGRKRHPNHSPGNSEGLHGGDGDDMYLGLWDLFTTSSLHRQVQNICPLEPCPWLRYGGEGVQMWLNGKAQGITEGRPGILTLPKLY